MLTPARFVIVVSVLLCFGVVLALGLRTGDSANAVVVYTSVDAEYAIPVFDKFTKQTGIKVIYHTDSEATKTTGMAQRLMQMKDAPDGDVFWNSELSFTQLLAKEGALESYASPAAKSIPETFKDKQNRWAGFGCRARVLIFNTDKIKRDDVPKTLEGLADRKFKNRICIAKPLFGTTRSHLVGLVIALGEERAFKLFRAWRENGVTLVESNGDVRNRVVDGLFDIGLTDSDDAFSALDRKKPVDFFVPDQTDELSGAFLIPNTVSMLKNCKHPAMAKTFIDFLLSEETEKMLAENGARQIPVRPLQINALPEALRNLKPVVIDLEKMPELTLSMAEKIYRVLSGETP